MHAAIGDGKGVVAQIEQGVESRVALEHDAAAVAAVAAIGAAAGHKFFAAEAQAAIAAPSAAHAYFGLINEHVT